MNVSDLQQHLIDLGRLLDSAGAGKTVPADLSTIARGLTPFRSLTLKEFADFLARADAFSRGEAPAVPLKAGRNSGRAGKTKKQAVDVDAIAAEVRALDERATDANVSEDDIRTVADKLAPLKKAQLCAVAGAIGFKPQKSLTVPQIREAIINRIIDRRGSFTRAGMINRRGDEVISAFAP
jgi:hypothetical protein